MQQLSVFADAFTDLLDYVQSYLPDEVPALAVVAGAGLVALLILFFLLRALWRRCSGGASVRRSGTASWTSTSIRVPCRSGRLGIDA
jgi:hypothetical protein